MDGNKCRIVLLQSLWFFRNKPLLSSIGALGLPSRCCNLAFPSKDNNYPSRCKNIFVSTSCYQFLQRVCNQGRLPPCRQDTKNGICRFASIHKCIGKPNLLASIPEIGPGVRTSFGNLKKIIKVKEKPLWVGLKQCIYTTTPSCSGVKTKNVAKAEHNSNSIQDKANFTSEIFPLVNTPEQDTTLHCLFCMLKTAALENSGVLQKQPQYQGVYLREKLRASLMSRGVGGLELNYPGATYIHSQTDKHRFLPYACCRAIRRYFVVKCASKKDQVATDRKEMPSKAFMFHTPKLLHCNKKDQTETVSLAADCIILAQRPGGNWSRFRAVSATCRPVCSSNYQIKY